MNLYEHENLEFGKMGNLEVWNLGNLEFGNLEVWKFGNLEIGNLESWEIGKFGSLENHLLLLLDALMN